MEAKQKFPRHRSLGAVALCVVVGVTAARADEFITKGSDIHVDVFAASGQLALDLRGGIWTLPAAGGEALRIAPESQNASRPRWSPDGRELLFQAAAIDGVILRIAEISSGDIRDIGTAAQNNQYASWHPEGKRIVYSSARHDSGFDIWETDVPTGLSWRVVSDPGDQLEAVWSADGRDLAYIERYDGSHSIVLRRRGRRPIVLVSGGEVLSSLAWRPDGTLLTFIRDDGKNLHQEMVILSDPPLVREFAEREKFVAAPVAWLDRHRHYYTVDGAIRTREFGDWQATTVAFRAQVQSPLSRPQRQIRQRDLPVITASDERLVIRGRRLFDGIWNRYRDAMDVLIEHGRIQAVTSRQDWPDATVLDLGDVTVLPGFVDTWSNLPEGTQVQAGAALLAYGVTSVVTDRLPDNFAATAWEGADSPGPRLLPAISLAAGDAPGPIDTYYLAKLAGTDLPAATTIEKFRDAGIPIVSDRWSPQGDVPADGLLGINALPRIALDGPLPDGAALTLVSGLADAATPGLDALLHSRHARMLGQTAQPAQRFAVRPALARAAAVILLGSGPNGLPPGLALHAELRALAAAGLSGEQVLHTAGRNPARFLGLENQVGTITPGAMADLVLVNGDPLAAASDALNIVAVVRNGRFYSVVRLLEAAGSLAPAADEPRKRRPVRPFF